MGIISISKLDLRALLICAVFISTSAVADYSPVVKASTKSSSTDSNGASFGPKVMMDSTGRYTVFVSEASNLIVGDSNDVADIFVFDKTNSTVSRASVNSSAVQADKASDAPSISDNGRYVVFESSATNLVSSDTNEKIDIFRFDRNTGTTIRVSVSNTEEQSDGDARNPVVSYNGRFVVFESDATNLVSSDSNGVTDIFIRDIDSETTQRLSISTTGTQGDKRSLKPAISADGSLIVFESTATNLVTDDTNEKSDIFLRNTGDDTTTLLSVSTSGTNKGNDDSTSGVISSDGTYVAYKSEANNLVTSDTNGAPDIFLYNLSGVTTIRISVKSDGTQADGLSSAPVISATGRYIAFESSATNLVTGSTDSNDVSDIFVHDRVNATTVRASVKSVGTQLSAASVSPSLNSDAHFLAFVSDSSTLVRPDSNDTTDVFLINLQCLVAPAGVTAGDADSDGTDDCDDDCPLDAAKLVPGTCGCGITDTDTDSDGTVDCNDACPADPLKIALGDCGCGVADGDANGNGRPDCVDPTTNTIPERPKVQRQQTKKGASYLVRIPKNFSKVTYQVQILKGKKVVASKTTSDYAVRFTELRGTFTARYRINVPGGGQSKFSRQVKFTAR